MMKAGQTSLRQSNGLISATLCAKSTATKKVTAKVTVPPPQGRAVRNTTNPLQELPREGMSGFSIRGAEILGAFSEALSHPEAFSPPQRHTTHSLNIQGWLTVRQALCQKRGWGGGGRPNDIRHCQNLLTLSDLSRTFRGTVLEVKGLDSKCRHINTQLCPVPTHHAQTALGN